MIDHLEQHDSIVSGLYRQMLKIRRFEERVASLYRAGEIPGFIHLYLGEEAVAAGVCANLSADDIITSTHRGHGHAIAKGCSMDRVMAELLGRKDGYSGGRGGSMHIYAPQHGLLGTNGIVGGGIPLAVGAGLTFKTLHRPNVAVTFFGDGASNAGPFYESINLAMIYTLPVVFICENNLYATSTALADVAGNPYIASRASAFGMPGVRVDGNDVVLVYQAAKEAIGRARDGGGPTLIEAMTYRICGHHEGDQIFGTYRTKEELDGWKEQCPIKRCARRLMHELGFSQDDLDAIDVEIGSEVDRAVEYSRRSPSPSKSDVQKHVFAEAR